MTLEGSAVSCDAYGCRSVDDLGDDLAAGDIEIRYQSLGWRFVAIRRAETGISAPPTEHAEAVLLRWRLRQRGLMASRDAQSCRPRPRLMPHGPAPRARWRARNSPRNPSGALKDPRPPDDAATSEGDPLVAQRGRGRAMERMIINDTIAFSPREALDSAAAVVSSELDLERAALASLEANRNLRQRLRDYDCVIEESLEKYRTGMRIRDVIRTMPPANMTAGSEVEMVDVFEARRALRKALVASLLADGMPVEEVATHFNVSIESICDLANDIGIPTE